MTSNRAGSSYAPFAGTACAAPTLKTGSDGNGNGLLDIGERWVYTCTEPLAWTTGDPDTWTVHDMATASGVGTVSGTTPSAPSNGVDVTVSRKPATIDVRKDAGPVVGPDSENGVVDARYTVTVTNSGQRDGTYGPLTDTPSFPAEAKVIEAKVMAPGATEYTTLVGAGPFTLTSGPTALAAGASHEYRVVIRYVWTKTASQSKAADCAAEPTPGQGLYNVASLPAGQETDTSNNAACSAPSPQPDHGIDLKKFASGPVDADHSGGVSEGDTMTYTFVVTNRSKTLTLKDIKVDDPTVGPVTCAQKELAVEASTTCTAAKYVLTQRDVDAGSIDNTATASGLPPGGLHRVTDTASTTTPLPSNGGLTLTKTWTNQTEPGQTPDNNDKIGYSFTVTNTGPKTLSNLVVKDSQVGTVTCAASTLAPHASTTCTTTGTHTVTADDITKGSVVNIATATAAALPDGAPVSADASATVVL